MGNNISPNFLEFCIIIIIISCFLSILYSQNHNNKKKQGVVCVRVLCVNDLCLIYNLSLSLSLSPLLPTFSSSPNPRKTHTFLSWFQLGFWFRHGISKPSCLIFIGHSLFFLFFQFCIRAQPLLFITLDWFG